MFMRLIPFDHSSKTKQKININCAAYTIYVVMHEINIILLCWEDYVLVTGNSVLLVARRDEC